MVLVAELQSWARCLGCMQVLWVEPVSMVNGNDQACGCECGNLQLTNDQVTGDTDETFTAADMQLILNEEYGT